MLYNIFLGVKPISLPSVTLEDYIMLIQVFYILFFYFIGEFLSYCIDGFIPGSVIGMILLFSALIFKVVKPGKVGKAAKILSENMGLFFIPAGVGLMNSMGLLSQYWMIIVITSVISTILVIASVAFVQQKMERKGSRR